MQDIIIEQETETESVPAASTSTDSTGPSETEQQLAEEIRELWAAHADAKTSVVRTREELREIRKQLGERLCQMKQALVKPGRHGGWSSFLRAEGIAKATADRLVRRHQESGGQQPNMVNEEVSTATGGERLFNSLLPRLKNNLTTSQSAYEFVLQLVGSFGLACDIQADGILVFNPTAREASGAIPVETAAGQADVAADATVGTAA